MLSSKGLQKCQIKHSEDSPTRSRGRKKEDGLRPGAVHSSVKVNSSSSSACPETTAFGTVYDCKCDVGRVATGRSPRLRLLGLLGEAGGLSLDYLHAHAS